MFVLIPILESRDNEIHIPSNGDAAADLLPSSHPERSSFVVKEARFSYDSKSGLMITTGRDIIARSGPPRKGVRRRENLSFAGNPDLNIELRATSVNFLHAPSTFPFSRFSCVSSLPPLFLPTCLLFILFKYLELSKCAYFDKCHLIRD